MDCIQCGETFFGDNIKFCSLKCYREYLSLKKIPKNTESDSSNTESSDDDYSLKT
ncbi:hypothetical protein BD31_I1213 [Candidatus Nitrosopumilus salaria BD31]|uniref:Uncharacterized protein n=1 Tax=Candidatus Nitrosopumilus salarius BD31 TaxID=859350 RepID=I3D4T1_9ARCH|nr:hypothetical protein BD31_I1213 [Candidatus Nitrosopumilus salaria BD31]